MYRLNLKLADYSKLAKEAKSIPKIAGRCSVFAKTDKREKWKKIEEERNYM